MSIRILPQAKEDAVKRTAEVIPPLLFPRLKGLYQRRSARLQQLANDNPLGDYLRFAAKLAHAQEVVLYDYPFSQDLTPCLEWGAARHLPPLNIQSHKRDPHWRKLLMALIAELKPEMSGPALDVIEALEKTPHSELEKMADAMLSGQFIQVGSDKAPFIWAALSVYWAQMASLIPGRAHAESGEQRQYCPVCGAMPVASIVHLGTNTGLRYLHCSLCESEWHLVRVKCSNCEETAHLDYWSRENDTGAVSAESCEDCRSYLKIFYQEKDPDIDPIADDLATLLLDARMEEMGYARSSVNPLMFPGE